MCHVSCVMCFVSYVINIFFFTKWLCWLVETLLSTGPTLSSLNYNPCTFSSPLGGPRKGGIQNNAGLAFAIYHLLVYESGTKAQVASLQTAFTKSSLLIVSEIGQRKSCYFLLTLPADRLR